MRLPSPPGAVKPSSLGPWGSLEACESPVDRPISTHRTRSHLPVPTYLPTYLTSLPIFVHAQWYKSATHISYPAELATPRDLESSGLLVPPVMSSMSHVTPAAAPVAFATREGGPAVTREAAAFQLSVPVRLENNELSLAAAADWSEDVGRKFLDRCSARPRCS